MSEHLALSIGLGLAVSLGLTEFFGIAAGGLVVPGYLALQVQQPAALLATLLIALLTYAVAQTAASFVILYGRRKTALMLIVGYVLSMLWRSRGLTPDEAQVMGFVVPGLLALWMERKGVWVTLAATTVATVLVRLMLIVILGSDLP